MSTLDERRARVKALAAKPLIEFDDKTPGSSVAGVVIEIEEATSDFGVFPVVTLDDGKRLVRVAAARSNVRKFILEHDVPRGDVLGIEYLARRT
jgi:hypothetical protein